MERRGTRRFSVVWECQCRVVGNKKVSNFPQLGTTINISKGGLFLLFPEPVDSFRVYEKVEAKISWPIELCNTNLTKLVIKGLIVRAGYDDRVGFCVAIKAIGRHEFRVVGANAIA